jgi:ATP-binding cassette, subfamily B, bacterial
VVMDRARGQIIFENIGFAYDERHPTLKGISFEASAGQVLAVVGPTGAGKSTLISLIPRFYDPAEGRVLLDGVDIRELTLESLRRQISMVLQEPLLFSTSIGENIRYGRLDATDEEVEEAAKAANAHDFIMRLPDGYKTVLGERGSRVSVGERQRITIARAFLKDAPILILDEPTSSIDTKTEASILDALDRLMIGRTTIMIAHRLSTVRHADWTVVLNHGEIAEQGTPDDLLAKPGGLYAQLAEIQGRRAARRSRRQIGPVAEPVEDLT